MNLGAVVVGVLYDEEVAKLLGQPGDEQPLYIIPVGRMVLWLVTFQPEGLLSLKALAKSSACFKSLALGLPLFIPPTIMAAQDVSNPLQENSPITSKPF